MEGIINLVSSEEEDNSGSDEQRRSNDPFDVMDTVNPSRSDMTPRTMNTVELTQSVDLTQQSIKVGKSVDLGSNHNTKPKYDETVNKLIFYYLTSDLDLA